MKAMRFSPALLAVAAAMTLTASASAQNPRPVRPVSHENWAADVVDEIDDAMYWQDCPQGRCRSRSHLMHRGYDPNGGLMGLKNRFENYLVNQIGHNFRHSKGVAPFGHYRIVYPVNPYYSDPRDAHVYATQVHGVPVAVPLAPNVHHTYNYGWGVPSSRLTPIYRTVTGY